MNRARLQLWRSLGVLVVVIATAKALLSVGGLATSAHESHAIPDFVFFLQVAVYAAAGLYLVVAGRADRRAIPLGLFFLTVASVFSEELLGNFANALPAAAPLLRGLESIPLDAYSAYFFWEFVRVFPRRPTDRTPVADAMVRVSLWAGTALLAVNLALRWGPAPGPAPAWRVLLGPLDSRELAFYVIVFGLILPALPYAWRQRYRATADERRRVDILMAGLIVGYAPTLLVVILSPLPVVDAVLSDTTGLRAVGLVVYPALLSIPITTGYAVLVHRALDVRLIVRMALRYALARYTVAFVVAVPLAMLLGLLWIGREESLARLTTGSSGVLLLLSAGTAALMARLRTPILERVDRRFFREEYDARRILGDLVQHVRSRGTAEELAVRLTREIDRALHLRSGDLLVLDPATGTLAGRGGRLRPLSVASPLARALEEAGTPLEVDWTRPDRALRLLPQHDREWLMDADARLLVPIVGGTGSLLGAMVLGEKRSELPFSGEDRLLLATIAGSTAMALEAKLQPRAAAGAAEEADGERPARECLGCGRVAHPDARRCEACGDSTAPSVVPLVLVGKFRLLDRLGRGGMGVVYHALDLSLDRDVAIKTLPRVSAGEAVRLRAEARAMAAVRHPNLALIFGAESWRGVPMLIVEFLAGGTLEELLRSRRARAEETVSLGVTLASALAAVHAAGILHRDIKPSNIGFAADGAVKLLDFGLARIVGAPGAEGGPTELVAATGFAGTPLYLSPETATGEPADVSADLWALGMVLYEMTAGRHPFEGETPATLPARIARADLPDVRTFAPDAPPALAELLAETLHPNRRRRPHSAAELRDRLLALPRIAEPRATAAGLA